MFVASLLLDFFSLLLAEEYIWGKWFARRLHAIHDTLFLRFNVHADEISEFSVPLLALLTILEWLHVLRLADDRLRCFDLNCFDCSFMAIELRAPKFVEKLINFALIIICG